MGQNFENFLKGLPDVPNLEPVAIAALFVTRKITISNFLDTNWIKQVVKRSTFIKTVQQETNKSDTKNKHWSK